jgi:hypothetical protein
VMRRQQPVMQDWSAGPRRCGTRRRRASARRGTSRRG